MEKVGMRVRFLQRVNGRHRALGDWVLLDREQQRKRRRFLGKVTYFLGMREGILRLGDGVATKHGAIAH